MVMPMPDAVICSVGSAADALKARATRRATVTRANVFMDLPWVSVERPLR
jgi:hypothetical protein